MNADPSIAQAQIPPSLKEIRDCIKDDWMAVDALMSEALTSNIPLIQTINAYIIQAGGKRLRPLLVLLSARATGYQEGTEHHELATVIEFIHTATLLHDDVVDASLKRRNRETVNAKWGNQTSVLVGDFLYSRAFQILARRDNIAVMKVLANTTNQISEGEVLQLMNQHNPEITENDYREVIRRKTAELFSAAALIGALISTKNNMMQNTMANFGLHLGIAFQMIDDLLDFTAQKQILGKNIGDDLAEGKITLPLIYALQCAEPDRAKEIRSAIQKGGIENLPLMLKIIEESQAHEYTFACAKKEIDIAITALQVLSPSPYKNALEQLAQLALERVY